MPGARPVAARAQLLELGRSDEAPALLAPALCQALIELRGGAGKVDPLIAKIAQAGPPRTTRSAAERAS